MKEKRILELRKLYKDLSDEKIIKLLSAHKADYEEGAYELICEEAKGRNLVGETSKANAKDDSLKFKEESVKKQYKFGTPEIIGGAVGLVIGKVIGIYLFIIILIPALLCWLVFNKIVRQPLKPIVPAIAALSVQILWIMIGLIFFRQLDLLICIDVTVLTMGLVWVMVHAKFAPAILLSVYQIIMFTRNIFLFNLFDLTSGESKSFLAHQILRLLSVVFIIVGAMEIRAQERSTGSDPDSRH